MAILLNLVKNPGLALAAVGRKEGDIYFGKYLHKIAAAGNSSSVKRWWPTIIRDLPKRRKYTYAR